MPSRNSEEFLKNLVDLMKERRAEMKFSHQQLADASGIDRAVISRLESMKRTPSILALYDLSEALQCPLDEFARQARDRVLESR